MTDIELRSLAPEYDEDYHKTYVARLNAAVIDPRNKNIALTGRYGAGKSSILDKFITEQEEPQSENTEAKATEDTSPAKTAKKKNTKKPSPKKVLRISINTLGPDKDEGLTNRIQKELVKQLVYRANPGEVRRSEFSRTPELSWWRTIFEAVLATTIVIGLLWLFGVRPSEDSFWTDGLLWPMIVFSALVFTALVFVRRYIGNRVVAHVSAGGASISLEGKSDSFFDKYLDELLAFFEATEPDIVVFEDLDRFNDPQIFDSLRELNTLVNTSAYWRKRTDRPLRFVYAIKDSLFEKFGDEQQEKDEDAKKTEEGASTSDTKRPEKKDAASEAVERANRTKFFEIVIPVVPFLSHNNARDHFLTELEKLKLPTGEGMEIGPGLIDIVARHTTDMRLMINIGNEFVVYAERLLWVDGTKRKRAPELTADLLFALVVYKNFHLADFEALPHRGSALDMLDQKRRDLVDAALKTLQTERGDLARGATRRQKQQTLAATLGARLTALQATTSMTLLAAAVGDVALDVDAANDRSFWQPIGQAGEVELRFRHRSGNGENTRLRGANLAALFPEVADADSWQDSPSRTDDDRIAEINAEITSLPRASLEDLAASTKYKLNDKTFAILAKDTLPSQLALDLVKQGYIDRFYAEYSTVFYGKFLGVDVANFFRNSVWPNEMDVQFKFTPEDAQNVLVQAPADFLRTRAALNIDIVNHLMTIEDPRSNDLIDVLARPDNEDGQQFLVTFFNTPESQSEALVARLAAKPWPTLFSFIASEGVIDADETTVVLLDAALRNASSLEAFELDDDARALIERLHTEIPTFRETPRGVSADTLFAFLTAALPIAPNIRVLSPELQALVVSEKRYALDANNLRAAAALSDETPIWADNLIAKPAVWAYCTENIEDYLELIESDHHTTASCESPGVLARVVNAQHEDWSADGLEAFLDATAESAALPDVNEVDHDAWSTVVARLCAVPNFTNLEAYSTEIGVDDALMALFTDDDGEVLDVAGLEDATTKQLAPVIPLLLNAHAVLEARQRVLLAKQLLDAPNGPGFDLSEVEATQDDLLAELLRERVVDDIEEAFTHFAGAGWDAIGPALQVSADAAAFITPPLVQGRAADVLREKSVPDATKHALLDQLVDFARAEAEFAHAAGQSFLVAAARTARTLGVTLSTEALTLLAPAVSNHEDVVWQLKEQAGSISVQTVMGILGSMSGDFAGFAGAAGQAFEVGNTQSLRAVVDRLKLAGVIKLQQGGQPRDRWKLRIA
ncbi:hypothetical protein ACNPNP_10710 [Microbacterium sp. AGC85]